MAGYNSPGLSVETIEDIAGTTMQNPLSYDDAQGLIQLLYGDPLHVTGAGALDVAADGIATEHLAPDAVTGTEIADAAVAFAQLAFDPATQGDLDTHAGQAAAHHARPTGTQATAISYGYRSDLSARVFNVRADDVPDSFTRSVAVDWGLLADGIRLTAQVKNYGGTIIAADFENLAVRDSTGWTTVRSGVWASTSTTGASWVSQTVEATFDAQYIEEVRTDITITDVSRPAQAVIEVSGTHPHTVGLPEHSHNI